MQQIVVSTIEEGVQKAKDILYKQVDAKTILFLSGGNTPKSLYESLTQDSIIRPAGVAMIDERFGEKMHEKSNERIIAQSGLLNYFQMLAIPWYPILSYHPELDLTGQAHNDISLEETAKAYDTQVRDLLFHFPTSIGILGIGADGHTAGIPAKAGITLENSVNSESLWGWRNPAEMNMASLSDLVTSYNDTTGTYGKRITMTFTALSMFDTLIVLAFGEDKKWALEQMYTQGSFEDIPARFYQQREIAQKTLIITDQNV